MHYYVHTCSRGRLVNPQSSAPRLGWVGYHFFLRTDFACLISSRGKRKMSERKLRTIQYRTGVVDRESPDSYRPQNGHVHPTVSSSLRKQNPSSDVLVRQNFRNTHIPAPAASTVESRTSPPTSFDSQCSVDTESQLTDMPYDMAHDTRPSRSITSRYPHVTVQSIAERMQPPMAVPQKSGHEDCIRGPRYSDPATYVFPHNQKHSDDQCIDNDDYEGSGKNEIDFRLAMEARRRTAHYTQLGYNQWERVDTNSRRSRPRNRGNGELPDDIDPFQGLDVDDNVEEEQDDDDHDDRPPPLRVSQKDRPLVLAQDNTSTERETVSKRRPPTNLQERSQQAWKSRQKKNSQQRKALHRSHREKQPGYVKSPPKVSFGEENSLKYYEPTGTSEGTDGSMGEEKSVGEEKSLNSEYTKTLESEVEDMIKDVLFIGRANKSRPGRRKYKYKHEMKRRQLEQEEMDKVSNGEEMETLDELDEDSDEVPVTRSRETKTSALPVPQSYDSSNASRDRETPLSSSSNLAANPTSCDYVAEDDSPLWTLVVEGGMTVVSSALGFLPERPLDPASWRVSQSGHDFCDYQVFPFPGCTGGAEIHSEGRSRKGEFSEVFEYAQSRVNKQLADQMNLSVSLDSGDEFNPPVIEESSDMAQSSQKSMDQAVPPRKLPFSMDPRDEDPRFQQLCLQAARSFHQMRAVEFDEEYTILHDKDIEISVVELKLPLGLIFLENEGGCFVTKVDSQGSAGRSGGVEVGDQLAAINGTSTFKMMVEKIFDMVSNAPNSMCIELMLIRYIGPVMVKPPTAARVLDSPSEEYDDRSLTENRLNTGARPEEIDVGQARESSIETVFKPKEKGGDSKWRKFRLFGRGKKN